MVAELNGRPYDGQEILPLALYGYGNFTTFLVLDGGVRGLGWHLERLEHDSQILHGKAVAQEIVRRYILHAIGNQKEATVVRVTAFRQNFDLANPHTDTTPDILVTTRGTSHISSPVSLKTLSFARELPELKTAGLSGSLYQRRQALQAGYDDALFVDQSGKISEGPTWNIGFIRGRRIILPDAPCLPGITVRLLQDSCQKHGPDVLKQPVGREDIAGMDAAFITNASTGVRTVARIDGRNFTPNPLVDELCRTYEQIPFERL